MTAIRVLELSGSHRHIGTVHGRAYDSDIRRYAAERIGLVTSGQWSGGAIDRSSVLAIAESCIPMHREFSPELTDEMEAIGDAAGLTLAEMIVVGGFTDFVDTVRAHTGGPLPDSVIEDDCTAFIVPDGLATGGAGFYGQTWDMHDSATEFVILTDIRPSDGPRAMVFTTTGCVGQLGMNESGLCVGINNLTAEDGRPGVTWPLVVRQALMQDDAEDARDVIVSAPIAGAHNYLVFDATGSGFNIEAFPSRAAVTPLEDHPIVHTNHALDASTVPFEIPRPPALQASSEARLQRAVELLDEAAITEEHLVELTRDEVAICQTACEPFHIESCGAAIMRPKSLDFWAVWGLPKNNAYERFTLETAPA